MSDGYVTLCHWTADESCARSILAAGFKDTTYWPERPGVHLCDQRDRHCRSHDDVLLVVTLPIGEVTDERLSPAEPERGHVDYVIPAAVIRATGWVERG